MGELCRRRWLYVEPTYSDVDPSSDVCGIFSCQVWLPANTRHFPNVVLTLGRRRRRRPNIKTTLGNCLEFADWQRNRRRMMEAGSRWERLCSPGARAMDGIIGSVPRPEFTTTWGVAARGDAPYAWGGRLIAGSNQFIRLSLGPGVSVQCKGHTIRYLGRGLEFFWLQYF